MTATVKQANALAWGAALVSAWVAAMRHDGSVQVGAEPWIWLGGLAGLHVAVAVPWLLVARGLGRPCFGFVAPVGLVALWLVLAWNGEPGLAFGPTLAAGARPDIVLVTLDTTRADFGGAEMPQLEALAAQGRWFSEAVTPAPLTAPAHASVLTGLSPAEHGLVSNGRSTDAPTVAEDLARAGYRTAAFLSARVLDRRTGLARGFSHYDDRWGFWVRTDWIPGLGGLGARHRTVERQGDEAVTRALTWLRSDDAPAFLWVHLYDPHAPYDPPLRFAPRGNELFKAQREDRSQPRSSGDLGAVLRGLSASRPNERRLAYEGEVAWVDDLVGRLLEGVADDAVVVVVGDHGESLGDNDYWFNHGARLWEACLRVPLVVRWPGRFEPGSEQGRLVSIAGVAPVLRSAGGVATRAGPLETGDDVVMTYTPGQEAHPTLGYRNSKERWRRGPLAAARLAGGKVVAFRGEPAVYYDLVTDPREERPVEVPEALAGVAAQVRAAADRQVEPLSAEQQAFLEVLGYTE